MFLRIDKLPVELPQSPEIDPIAAKNVQELLGGRFGEMSTLMNYTFQSFNMRGRDTIKPYYALISNIAAEEGGHIEIVSAAINSLLNGPRQGFDNSENPLDAPWQDLPGGTLGGHYIAAGANRSCQWIRVACLGTADYVFLQRQPHPRSVAQLLPRKRRAHAKAARLSNDGKPGRTRHARLLVRARRCARHGLCQSTGNA
jgi:hypothetical protein